MPGNFARIAVHDGFPFNRSRNFNIKGLLTERDIHTVKYQCRSNKGGQ
jgi:hypothetical protein